MVANKSSSTSDKNHFKKYLDSKWRLNHLYKIIDKNSNLVTFQENSIQEKINACVAQKKMILKPRQIGSTTNEILKLLDQTIYRRNRTNCIMAHENDAIKKIFRIATKAYYWLPSELKPLIDRGGGSKYELSFPKLNSLIYCDLESRGDTISHLHISEAAFVEYDRFISTIQAVPIGGSVTIESTPNGIGNFFYDLWHEDNDYEKLFFPWFLDKAYRIDKGEEIKLSSEEERFKKHAAKGWAVAITDDQIRWRRQKQKELKHLFLQEYPEDDTTCFLLSKNNVLDLTIVKKLSQQLRKPVENEDGIKIFKKKEASNDYVIGADVAQGTGNDYSVAVVYHIATMEEVALLRGQYSPLQFARKLKGLCDLFSTGFRVPLLAVENNNHGHAVLLELVEHIGYPNLYYAKKDVPGWVTNAVTRPIMMDQFVDSIENGIVKINSRDTIGELMTLVNDRGKIQAASGRHDDCVMAHAVAVQMLLEERSKISLYDNIDKAIYL